MTVRTMTHIISQETTLFKVEKSMFGIGTQEILVVMALALILIGPKKLPEVARALGKGFGEFRRAFDDLKDTMDVDMKTEKEKDLLLKHYPHLADLEKQRLEEDARKLDDKPAEEAVEEQPEETGGEEQQPGEAVDEKKPEPEIEEGHEYNEDEIEG